MPARKPPARRPSAPAKPAPEPPPRPDWKRDAPSAAPPELPSSAPAPSAEPRYRVLSGGISTPGGAYYHGAIVTAAQLGDVARVAALLERGAIVEETHAD